MALPGFQKLMFPMLQLLDDGAPHAAGEITEHLATRLGLTADERRQTFASGSLVFADRASWARSYMKQAGLLEYPRRGYSQVTSRGREAFRQAQGGIDLRFLRQYAEFRDFEQRSVSAAAREARTGVELTAPELDSQSTPSELMETGYRQLRASVERDLLARVLAGSPEFFENLVIQLLVALGYGGSMAEAEVVGRAGDGGIDGIVKQDRLGLDNIYVQAKRWNSTVGRPVVQAFVGALHGVNARRGILLTTSTFTREAAEYAKSLDYNVVLVDGPALAALMFDSGLGVNTTSSFVVKQVDSDFFEDQAATAAGA